MPDFDAKYTSGIAVANWEDPEDPPAGLYKGAPSRLNAGPIKHLQFRASLTVLVEVSMIVAGVLGETDANLGGRLFSAWWIEEPYTAQVLALPAFSNPAGQSSVQRFVPTSAGHHVFGVRRDTGGALIFHVEAY